MIELLQRKLALLLQLLHLIRMDTQTENGKKVLDFCLKNLNRSFGNQYVDTGCAEEVNAVVSMALGFKIGGGASTYLMYRALQDKNRFVKVMNLLGGEIVISPSGYGSGMLSNGHVGIYLGNDAIGSNDSRTGLCRSNYTIRAWRERYAVIGDVPMEYYRIL